jgi:hypothetical protein
MRLCKEQMELVIRLLDESLEKKGRNNRIEAELTRNRALISAWKESKGKKRDYCERSVG